MSKEEQTTLTEFTTFEGSSDKCSIGVSKRNPELNSDHVCECSKDDGYHTMDELYEHRTALFSVICNMSAGKAWKSKQHHPNGDCMYDGYFIAGILTPEGQYTYHCELKYWDWYDVPEIEHAPEFDGHQPKDYTRLFRLPKEGKR